MSAEALDEYEVETEDCEGDSDPDHSEAEDDALDPVSDLLCFAMVPTSDGREVLWPCISFDDCVQMRKDLETLGLMTPRLSQTIAKEFIGQALSGKGTVEGRPVQFLLGKPPTKRRTLYGQCLPRSQLLANVMKFVLDMKHKQKRLRGMLMRIYNLPGTMPPKPSTEDSTMGGGGQVVGSPPPAAAPSVKAGVSSSIMYGSAVGDYPTRRAASREKHGEIEQPSSRQMGVTGPTAMDTEPTSDSKGTSEETESENKNESVESTGPAPRTAGVQADSSVPMESRVPVETKIQRSVEEDYPTGRASSPEKQGEIEQPSSSRQMEVSGPTAVVAEPTNGSLGTCEETESDKTDKDVEPSRTEPPAAGVQVDPSSVPVESRVPVETKMLRSVEASAVVATAADNVAEMSQQAASSSELQCAPSLKSIVRRLDLRAAEESSVAAERESKHVDDHGAKATGRTGFTTAPKRVSLDTSECDSHASRTNTSVTDAPPSAAQTKKRGRGRPSAASKLTTADGKPHAESTKLATKTTPGGKDKKTNTGAPGDDESIPNPTFHAIKPLLRKAGFYVGKNLYCRPGVDPDNTENFKLGEEWFEDHSDLRAHLCSEGVYGFDPSAIWTDFQKEKVRLWVRHAIIEDADEVVMSQIHDISGTDAVNLLFRLGFKRYTYCGSDCYIFPGVQRGGEVLGENTFQTQKEWFDHLGRFGLPKNCDTSEISQEALLRLKLFLADNEIDTFTKRKKETDRRERRRKASSDPEASSMSGGSQGKQQQQQQSERKKREKPATHPQVHKVGTNVRKKFFDGSRGKWYNGRIASYDAKLGLYRVKYDDSDSEECSVGEIEKIIVREENVSKKDRQRQPHPQVHKVGTSVRKKFFDGSRGKWYNGRVTSYNTKSGLYRVKYEDSDSEECSVGEIEKIVVLEDSIGNKDIQGHSSSKAHGPNGSAKANKKSQAPSSTTSKKNVSSVASKVNGVNDSAKSKGPSSTGSKKKRQLFSTGTLVRKYFESEQEWFDGRVVSFHDGLYRVVYEDEDKEDLSEAELKKIVVSETDSRQKSLAGKKRKGVSASENVTAKRHKPSSKVASVAKRKAAPTTEKRGTTKNSQDDLMDEDNDNDDGATREAAVTMKVARLPSARSSSPTVVSLTSLEDTSAENSQNPENETSSRAKLKACLQMLDPHRDVEFQLFSSGSTHLQVRLQRVFSFVTSVILSGGNHAFEEDDVAALYVCGAPGVGKTSGVHRVCKKAIRETVLEDEDDLRPVFCPMNAGYLMSAQNPTALFLEQISDAVGMKQASKSKKQLVLALKKSKTMLLITLDEIDMLVREERRQVDGKLTGAEAVVQTLLEWSNDPSVPVAFIAISNATGNNKYTRIHSIGEFSETVTFKTYTENDLIAIIQARVGQTIVAPPAVMYIAKKVSATSGDARKALELAASAVRESLDALPEDDQAPPSGTLVTMRHVHQAVKKATPNLVRRIDGLPTLGKVILCCLSQLARAEVKSTTLGKLKGFVADCMNRHFSEELCDVTQFTTLVSTLVDMGLLATSSTTNWAADPNKFTAADLSTMPIQLGMQLEDVCSILHDDLGKSSYYRLLLEHARIKGKQWGC